MKNIILFLFLLLFAALQSQAQIEGYWKGEMNVGVQKLETAFDIKAVENGYAATFDVPAQGAYNIPVDETTFQDGHLQLTMSALGARYSGTLKDNVIEGEFTQNGMTFPLNLARSEMKEQKKTRPQDPQPPFHYQIEEVTFVNEKEGNTLAGTLTIPEGEGPFPAMVLVSGSGQQNRDEELMNHRPFWVIADYCARHGIAVLRYDDRGVGGSDGEVKNATSMDFSYDAEAAFDYLRNRKEINATKVGILGHSEGGVINFMVSSRRPEVAFLVSLAGPSVNGIEVLKEQQAAILRASGMTEEMVQFNGNANAQMFDIIETSNDREEADSLLRQLLKGWGYNDELTEQTVGQMASPWMYYFLRYDPTDAIVKTNCPALLLNGTKDLQVIASQNLPGYEKIIAEHGKTNLTLRELPDLNHLFQHCETGSPNEYFEIEETISPEVLEMVVGFVKGIEK
ncbi:MAG: hydrolase, alpha/beta domain-containing protein [bacterium F083]|nr:MAG: hydrolase, alpha/beta domain-containing protein [bacterium F083]